MTKYAQSFTGTSVTVAGISHGITSNSLFVQIWFDTGTVLQNIFPPITVDKTSFDVTATFGEVTTGKIVIAG